MSDCNGYNNSNHNEKKYFLDINENGVNVKILREDKESNQLYYTERISRDYVKIFPPSDKVYGLHRHYRHSTNIKGLKMMVLIGFFCSPLNFNYQFMVGKIVSLLFMSHNSFVKRTFEFKRFNNRLEPIFWVLSVVLITLTFPSNVQ